MHYDAKIKTKAGAFPLTAEQLTGDTPRNTYGTLSR